MDSVQSNGNQVDFASKIGHHVIQIIRLGTTARAFQFSLARVAQFPATVYLEPEPAAPFIAPTEGLVSEFPQFSPFAGEFPTIIPHLTVARGSATEAELAQAELVAALAAHGSIKSACSSLVLIEN
jgi:hypothetical protein